MVRYVCKACKACILIPGQSTISYHLRILLEVEKLHAYLWIFFKYLACLILNHEAMKRPFRRRSYLYVMVVLFFTARPGSIHCISLYYSLSNAGQILY